MFGSSDRLVIIAAAAPTNDSVCLGDNGDMFVIALTSVIAVAVNEDDDDDSVDCDDDADDDDGMSIICDSLPNINRSRFIGIGCVVGC